MESYPQYAKKTNFQNFVGFWKTIKYVTIVICNIFWSVFDVLKEQNVLENCEGIQMWHRNLSKNWRYSIVAQNVLLLNQNVYIFLTGFEVLEDK